MVTLDSALDAVMQLSFSERKSLVDILNKRLIEERRDEISIEIKETSALYNSGKIKTQPVENILSELHSSLDRDE